MCSSGKRRAMWKCNTTRFLWAAAFGIYATVFIDSTWLSEVSAQDAVVPNLGSPTLRTDLPATNRRIGTASPSAPNELVAVAFLDEVATAPSSWKDAVTIQWAAALTEERSARRAERALLDPLNTAAANSLYEPDLHRRHESLCTFWTAQSSVVRARVLRMRAAVAALADYAGTNGVPPDMETNALRRANGVLALQQGFCLVGAGGLAGADGDFSTAVRSGLATLQAAGIAIDSGEFSPCLEALRNYELDAGRIQASRLDVASLIGAHGVEFGKALVPSAELQMFNDASWSMEMTNRRWLPALLTSMPPALSAMVSPELLEMIAPEVFPDSGSARVSVESCITRVQRRPELADEVRMLSGWFTDAYRIAEERVIHADAMRKQALFGPPSTGRLTREEADLHLAAALAERARVNQVAFAWIDTLGVGIDVDRERRAVASDAEKFSDQTSIKRDGRRD